MTDAPVALDLLRRQIAGLLSQIDTATLPQPDQRHAGLGEKHPGSEWRPASGWQLRTVDTPEDGGFVYLNHDCDDSLSYRWSLPGDLECLRPEDARRIGLAFLAAAAQAEEVAARVTRPASSDERPAEVREMKPRGRR